MTDTHSYFVVVDLWPSGLLFHWLYFSVGNPVLNWAGALVESDTALWK